MLILHHAPHSCSSRFIWLLEELKAPYEVCYLEIPRPNGTGKSDPSNPDPDKKVPALVHDDALVTESAATCLYLSDLFPKAKIRPLVGDAKRGPT